jgi:translation elongation factor aEF-1 beta
VLLEITMGIAAVIVKIMPSSPDANLDMIKNSAKELMEKEGAKNISFEVRDIAFGLRAVIMKMAWIEEKDTSIIEDGLAKIDNVSSVMIEDYRRAFG